MVGLRKVRRGVALGAVLVAMAAFLPAQQAVAVNSAQNAIVSANPADWTPNIQDGRVEAIVQIGTKVIAGGDFTKVQAASGGPILSRPYIFAFDMNTGVIDPNFTPALNNHVFTLAPGPDGKSVFVGGTFTTVNGASVKRLTRLNLSNGQVFSGFSADTNAVVWDLRLRGSWLYAAGDFSTIKGVPRGAFARISPNTGAVDPNLDLPFTGNPGGLRARAFDVSPDGSKAVVIGNFDHVGGVPRDQITILDLTTTPVSVSSWSTDLTPYWDPADPTHVLTYCSHKFATWLRDVDISPDGTYFVLVDVGANRPGRLCDTATRWELSATGPHQTPTWQVKSGGDSFMSVAVTGTAVYIGGHQQYMNNPYVNIACGICPGPFPGAVSRMGISAHDPINGMPFSWNPVRNPRGKGVLAMPATPDGLWVGSNTDHIAGETHGKIALMPLLGGLVVPPNVPYTLPGSLFVMNGAGQLVKRSFDGTTLGAAGTVGSVDWSNARGAFALNGVLYTAWSDGTLTSRSFDGSTLGAPTTMDLHGLNVAPDPLVFSIPGTSLPIPAFTTDLANMTGMFWDSGRIYYTVQGNPRLYYRYFTPQSQIMGAALMVGSTGDGVDWANVRGMTLASGNLYFALADGTLNRVAWSNGHPSGAVTTIGGPGVDATNYASKALFVFNP